MITTINEWKLFNKNKKEYEIKEQDFLNSFHFTMIKTKTKDQIGKADVEIIVNNKEHTVGYKYQKEDYIYIRLIMIYKEYKRQGYSKILISHILEKFKNKNMNIYLSSGPLFDNDIPLDDLVKLYESFGFIKLEKNNFGYDMVKYADNNSSI